MGRHTSKHTCVHWEPTAEKMQLQSIRRVGCCRRRGGAKEEEEGNESIWAGVVSSQSGRPAAGSLGVFAQPDFVKSQTKATSVITHLLRRAI